jgi:hypothetical protein
MAKARCSASPCFEFIPDDILKKSAVARDFTVRFESSSVAGVTIDAEMFHRLPDLKMTGVPT